MYVSEKLLSVALLSLFLASCTGPTPDRPLVAPELEPFMADLSVNEIMVGQIDHAANFILDLGIDENQQLLQNAWEEAEHHAIQLMASSSALSLGGTGISDGIWSSQPSWRYHSEQLHNAAAAALLAARAQDLISMQIAAEQLRTACDNCHLEFKPEIPTQGYYRRHY